MPAGPGQFTEDFGPDFHGVELLACTGVMAGPLELAMRFYVRALIGPRISFLSGILCPSLIWPYSS